MNSIVPNFVRLLALCLLPFAAQAQNLSIATGGTGGVYYPLGGGMANVIAAVAIFSVPTFARLVRGNTLALKHLTFVEAARSLGASDRTIVFRHIFPGTISAVVVYSSLRIGTSIITGFALTLFIGVVISMFTAITTPKKAASNSSRSSASSLRCAIAAPESRAHLGGSTRASRRHLACRV